MSEEFGKNLRKLRRDKGLTLRALADIVGVDISYLSKIENGRAGYLPGADTVRELAKALEVDAIELLELANKLPPELAGMASSSSARRFYSRATEIASPRDWDALLDFLEERKQGRSDMITGEERKR